MRRLGRWSGTCASRRLHIGCTVPIRRRCQEGREFSNVVRQHEKLTGKHRPGNEGRTSSKRCRVASSNRPCTSVQACLAEMVEMSEPTVNSANGATSRYVHRPVAGKLNRAMPHVRFMLTAMRDRDRTTALAHGETTLQRL